MKHRQFKMETVTLNRLYNILNKIDQRLRVIEAAIEEQRLEVRPEYLEKLKRIEKGRFLSRKEFEKEMASS